MTYSRRLLRLSVAVGAILFSGSAFATDPYQLDQATMTALAARASSALRAPILTVIDKPQASPSGDAHDYVSFARYYWPDPTKPDGLPYVSRDGHHNVEQVARGDHERLWDFAKNVEELAAAWRINHDDAAARRAGAWLRAWFVTPSTRMNPNMDYAQVRLGHNKNHGSQSGVLDARCLSQVVDALLLLHGSPALTGPEEATVQAWFSDYLGWLGTAKNARDEHAAKNNHGTWFLAQMVPIARYSGRDDLARQLCEEDKSRIANQFKPDGSQPLEIARVDGLGYSVFNLDAQFQVARIAEELGVDLWNFSTPEGTSLRSGLTFLLPYNANPSAWPTSQNEKFKPGFLDGLIAQAQAAWPDFAKEAKQ